MVRRTHTTTFDSLQNAAIQCVHLQVQACTMHNSAWQNVNTSMSMIHWQELCLEAAYHSHALLVFRSALLAHY